MTSQSAKHFQNELRVFTEAEVILTIRREIIRLQADREKLREAMRGLEAHPQQHRVFESCTVSIGNNAPLFFLESSRTEALSYINSERKRLDRELEALEKDRKKHLSTLLEMRPETTSMSKADIDFLLKEVKAPGTLAADDEVED
eukprot:Protomagalhaensia_wolfi_Nauph_80__4056@NODE_411_length_2573_cov_45_191792_g308_i0_p4_GENE_NODE_411_length_2573_cov_45_191792_g308_i0NODE_411_length_2573_cov_45_191792_g308_i0_p4_ORF_typecomplete_len145_score18_43Prefoldin_2/PF01920_20/3e05Prefoldin/PF02996_17/3_7e02Prefoldin/PF02996_17/0_016DUF4600/PF15372_6/0_0044DUF4164/PF13747_6/1_8DUF4164/PF13747_6/1_6SPAM/PF02090_15/10SPAM/PF02090_15/0_07FAM184/PF15665_5/0_021DUF2203/PF09969_9/0_067TMF_TATA_bd/PF12325_8/3_4TMF_TATA_bd/PF12325_8/1_5Nsp1_C/PF